MRSVGPRRKRTNHSHLLSQPRDAHTALNLTDCFAAPTPRPRSLPLPHLPLLHARAISRTPADARRAFGRLVCILLRRARSFPRCFSAVVRPSLPSVQDDDASRGVRSSRLVDALRRRLDDFIPALRPLSPRASLPRLALRQYPRQPLQPVCAPSRGRLQGAFPVGSTTAPRRPGVPRPRRPRDPFASSRAR